jgi:hypothetical protein
MKCGFVWAEKAGQQKVRTQPQVRHCLLAALPCVLVIAGFAPCIITGEISLKVAGEICKDNYVNRLWENEAERHDLESFEDAVEHVNKRANCKLYMTYESNVTAAFVSLVCFLLWVFFTAHSASSATRLDQTRMPSLLSRLQPTPRAAVGFFFLRAFFLCQLYLPFSPLPVV